MGLATTVCEMTRPRPSRIFPRDGLFFLAIPDKLCYLKTMKTETISPSPDRIDDALVRLYSRDTLESLPAPPDGSAAYSRSVARDIFSRYPNIEFVEYVGTGRKTDSSFVGERGVYYPPANVVVYVSSTGGRYGKSSRSYYPAS